jgi:predicted nucleic acid-binding protein
MTPIIIDSSALVALMYPGDADHGKALALSTALGHANRAVLVPLEVLAETLNILGKKFGRTVAVTVGERLLRGEGLLIFQPTEAPIRPALAKWRGQAGGVSYTDCVVMAYADQYQTKEIFGFDDAFRKNGYRLPAASAEGREAA